MSGTSGAERRFNRGVRFVHERRGRRECLFDQRHWSDDGGLADDARLDARELQHPFDGLTQAAGLGTDGGAVLLDPGRVLDDAMRQIVRRRSNHRNGRAQLVRHARDELELLPREPLRAARRNHNQANADAHQDENPEAQRQVASSGLSRPRLRAIPRDVQRAGANAIHRPPPAADRPRMWSGARTHRRTHCALESRPSGFCTVRIVVDAWRSSGN